MKNMNTLTRRSRWLAPVLVGALALPGCSSDTKPNGDTSAAPASGVGASPNKPVQPLLRFNDLGGGSPIIMVYPGVSESSADKVYNGTYSSGQIEPIDCHTTGREVTSHPELGEEKRSSVDWYKLVGDKVHYYASATYGDVIPEGAVVKECPAPPALPAQR